MRAVVIFALLALLPSLVLAQQFTEDFKDPEQMYAFAAGLAERHYDDLAVEHLQAFLRRYADHRLTKSAYQHLIECYSRLGRNAEMEDAIAAYRQRWPQAPELVNFALAEGNSRFARQDYAGAQDCFAKVAKSGDEAMSETGKFYLAQCEEKQNRHDKALDWYRDLARKPLAEGFAYRPYAVYSLALQALQDGKLEEARQLCQRLLAYQETPSEITRDVLFYLASAEYATNHDQEAVARASQYLRNFGNEKQAEEMRRLRLRAVYRQKEYQQFVALVQEYKQHHQGELDQELSLCLGLSLEAMERYGEAVVIFLRLGEDTSVPEHLRRKCLVSALDCLRFLNRDEELIVQGKSFLERYPNSAEKGTVLEMLGGAYRKLHKLEDATDAYASALEFRVGDKERFQQTALLLADCQQELQQWSAAARTYRRLAPELPPEQQPACLENALNLELKAGNQEQVAADAQEMLRRWPDNQPLVSRLLDILFRLQLQQGKWAEGAATLERLLPLAPKDRQAELVYWLARARIQCQQTEEALSVLNAFGESVKDWQVPAARNLLLALQLELKTGREEIACQHAGIVLGWEKPELDALVTPELMAAAATLLEKKMDYAQAEKAWKLGLANAKEQVVREQLVLGLSQLLLRLGRGDEAGDCLASAFKDSVTGEMRLPSAQVCSLLAEMHLQKHQYREALALVEKALSGQGSLDMRTQARLWWVKAMILFEDEHDVKAALPLCLKVYVMYDDAIYSPRAMHLALRLWLAQGKKTEAATVWKEMQNRYPSWAAEISSSEEVKGLE
ncbi:MAG: tetratricopeptide repeat protein [Victivallales bacterium]|nr:tetratricopeptide repeat protein [Victivallales bacterium]